MALNEWYLNQSLDSTQFKLLFLTNFLQRLDYHAHLPSPTFADELETFLALVPELKVKMMMMMMHALL